MVDKPRKIYQDDICELLRGYSKDQRCGYSGGALFLGVSDDFANRAIPKRVQIQSSKCYAVRACLYYCGC